MLYVWLCFLSSHWAGVEVLGGAFIAEVDVPIFILPWNRLVGRGGQDEPARPQSGSPFFYCALKSVEIIQEV